VCVCVCVPLLIQLNLQAYRAIDYFENRKFNIGTELRLNQMDQRTPDLLIAAHAKDLAREV